MGGSFAAPSFLATSYFWSVVVEGLRLSALTPIVVVPRAGRSPPARAPLRGASPAVAEVWGNGIFFIFLLTGFLEGKIFLLTQALNRLSFARICVLCGQ